MLNKRTVILGIAAFLTLLLAGGAAWFKANQDRFAQALVERLEERLVTDAHIEHIELDLWSHFPEVSLVLQDAWLLGSHSQTDTLLKASEVAVAFNALHLMRGRYTLRALEVSGGYVALASKEGAWNTDVWQSTEDDTERAAFAIEQLALRGMRVDVNGEAVEIDRADFAFNWTDSGVLADGYGLFNQLMLSEFFTDEAVEWRGDLDWNANDKSVRMVVNELQWSGITADLAASFDGGWRVSGSALNVTLNALRKALGWQNELLGLETTVRASGEFNWDGRTFKSNWTLPMADWDLPIDNQQLALEGEAKLWVKFENNEWRADAPKVNVRGNGFLWSGAVERILFETGSFEALGEGMVDWSEHPLDWFPSKHWPSKGQINWNGMVKRKRSGAMDWNGQWTALACEGLYRDTPWEVSGRGFLEGPAVVIDSLNARWDGLEFSAVADGQLPLSEQPIAHWNGTVRMPKLAFDSKDSSAVALDDLRLPSGISTNLDVRIDLIEYEAWRLQSAKLQLKGSPTGWTMPRFSAQTLNGQLNGGGALNFDPAAASATVLLHPKAQKCDLRQLFVAFENFDQTTLRAEHLSGTFDASGSVQFALDADLQWDASSLDILGSASIHDGELKRLEAFQDIANYLRSNRLMAPLVDPDDLAQRLEEVQFEQVETPVYVSKGVVQVPHTSIPSSAMDITLEGLYRFDSSVNYTLGFALRDLRSSGDDEFGAIEDDGLGHQFFVSMTGTVDEPVYGWDRDAQKNHRKENFQREKDLLKELFRKSKP